LDCCAGEQKIWKELRKTCECSYLGIDKKEIKGTLKMDSVKYLQRGHGAAFDIIDIDTYGCPFRHLAAVVRYIRKPTTVFLTFGLKGVGSINGEALTALGINFPVPRAIAAELSEKLLGDVIVGIVHPHTIEYMTEAPCGSSENRDRGRFTRYVGLRIIP
jgi:hypothetical protein